MSVLVIDYGMGNLASVKRAFEECGANVFLSDNPADINQATKLLLPGVGSFAMAMDNIKKTGWFDALQDPVLNKKIPILGVCLGMQLLADEGEEHGITSGLGFIPGSIKKLDGFGIRIPHVGWNEITKQKDDKILARLNDGTDFYFVHSYYFHTKNTEDISATTPYGEDFPSVISHENIYGTQFHPEKSGFAGFQIIKNFIAL